MAQAASEDPPGPTSGISYRNAPGPAGSPGGRAPMSRYICPLQGNRSLFYCTSARGRSPGRPKVFQQALHFLPKYSSSRVHNSSFNYTAFPSRNKAIEKGLSIWTVLMHHFSSSPFTNCFASACDMPVTFLTYFTALPAPWVSSLSLASTIHLDRKSTRLNSSHVAISYAVFCLKKN